MSFSNESEMYGIHHSFQPIWNIAKSTISGYESFTRHNPGLTGEKVYSIVREHNHLYQHDIYSIEKAIEAFPFLKSHFLFTSIFPSTLFHETFPRFLNELIKKFPDIIGRLVLQLDETYEGEHRRDLSDIKNTINTLQELGIFVAITNVGKGINSLKKMTEIKPSIVKLSSYLSLNLNTSEQKQKVVSLLVDYCTEQGIVLIMEGIKSSIDLSYLKKLKVTLGQGDLLGRPSWSLS